MHRFNDTYLAAARRCVCGAKEGAEAMEARLTALSYTRSLTLSLSHTLAHTPSLSQVLAMARTGKQSWLTLHPAGRPVGKASSHGGCVPQVDPPPPGVARPYENAPP